MTTTLDADLVKILSEHLYVQTRDENFEYLDEPRVGGIDEAVNALRTRISATTGEADPRISAVQEAALTELTRLGQEMGDYDLAEPTTGDLPLDREALIALGWTAGSLDYIERLTRGEHLGPDFLKHAAKAEPTTGEKQQRITEAGDEAYFPMAEAEIVPEPATAAQVTGDEIAQAVASQYCDDGDCASVKICHELLNERDPCKALLAVRAALRSRTQVTGEVETLANRCNWMHSRIQHRVDAIIERDGSTEAAVTGNGVGISFLLARDTASLLRDAAIVLRTRAPEPTAVQGVVDFSPIKEASNILFNLEQATGPGSSLDPRQRECVKNVRERLDALIASKLIAPMPTREEVESAIEGAVNDEGHISITMARDSVLGLIKGER